MTHQVLQDYIGVWLDAFIVAKRAGGMTENTVLFYTRKLRQFNTYCEAQSVKQIEQISPAFIREYLLYLQQGHNAGGVHACYRALRAFLNWYERETDDYNNPIRRVKAPRVKQEPIEGVPLSDISAMVKISNVRDHAILLCLLDTGCRASEFISIDIQDVNLATGEILLRRTKGQRPRYVYLGRTARKALRKYIKSRTDAHPALWYTREDTRLSVGGLRHIVIRRAKQADVKPPSLHSFRRSFALNYLRNGGDIFTLQKIMGHSDLTVLRRYLALTDTDMQQAHVKYSPVDNL